MENKLIRYECVNCGNKCLKSDSPDNSVCGGCKNPDWKILIHQESYIVGEDDWIHPKGEI